MIEQWVLEKIDPLKKESLIILRDPQRMLKPGDYVVDGWAEEHGFFVPFCSGNMALREMVEFAKQDPSLRYLVVDRSREDAKIPLFYPDLDAVATSRAHIGLSLRDFLVEKTGDQNWPHLVNERKLSNLILNNLEGTLQTHQYLRHVHPTRFTDTDCYKILLGGELKINPFRRLSTTEIRRLCIEQHDAIDELKSILPDEVMGALHETIQRAEKPFCWLLQRDPTLIVRAFTLAAILHQHDLEYQILLSNLDPALHDYREIQPDFLDKALKDQIAADPDKVIADVEDVENFLLENPDQLAFLLRDRLQIEKTENAYTVLKLERLSILIRGMALVSLLIDLIDRRDIKFHKKAMALLEEQTQEINFPALSRPTDQWEVLISTYQRAISVYELTSKLADHVKRLQVALAEELAFEDFDRLWNQDRLNRLDFYLSDLDRKLRVGDMLPAPLKSFWPELESRWINAREKLNEVIKIAHDAMDIVDRRFQDFYRLHYTKWINQDDAPVVFTHQFLNRILKPHWDPQTKTKRKAVVMVFDGMRTDAWDEFLRPVLEERFEVIESRPGSAILPTETMLTRKAISAGCLPTDFVDRCEDKLLQNWLKEHMGLNVNFEVLRDDDTIQSGMTVRYSSEQLDYIIFNFTDNNLHHNNQELSFIYNHTVREIIRQDVRSVLRELPDDALIFVTSDHGFVPMPQDTYTLPDDTVVDVHDIKYRNARTISKPEGAGIKEVIDFDVRVMGIPDDSPSVRNSQFNYVLFPRPGRIFRRWKGPHAPDRYSHGGLSLAECLVPMVVLGPKVERQYLLLIENMQQVGSISEGEPLSLEITLAPGTLAMEEIAITLSFSQEEILTRKEIFKGQKTKYIVNWTPKIADLSEEERQQGEIKLPVTLILSYRQDGEIVRFSKTTDVRIKLDPTRLHRRIDSKLDFLMGKVPKDLKS